MKKQWKLIIAFICAMLLTVAVVVIMIVPGQDAELNIDETRKSVVAIVSGVDVEREILTSDVIVGTGFCYEPGMVITNYHNVQNGDENITLITYDDTVISAKIVAKDEQNDIALLQIDHDLPHLILRSSENCAQGDEVMSISTPISAYLRGTYSKGYITNKDVVGFGSQRLLQSNIELSPGCSGAPLLDSDGCVLGMVTFKSTEFGAEGLGFAIPGERLLQMIDRLEQEIVTPDLMIEFENDIY